MRLIAAIIFAGCACEVDDAGIVADVLAESNDEVRVLLEDGRRVTVAGPRVGLLTPGDCVTLNECESDWTVADEDWERDRWACEAVR